MRPTGIDGMTPKSVKKKLKQPSFAAGVNRDEVREGAEELGVDFDEHVAFVIAAMEERADELGLGPGNRRGRRGRPPANGEAHDRHRQATLTPCYGLVEAVVANTSVRFAAWPLLARTRNGLKPGFRPPPAKSRPS